MSSRIHYCIPTVAVALIFAAPASGQPDLANCSATTAATEQVSVLVLPNGMGTPLSECYDSGYYPGADATITVTLNDASGNPVVGYPAEYLSLDTEFGGLVVCPCRAVADGATDDNGQTTFSGPIWGGGHSDRDGGERLRVVIDGQPLVGWEMDILINSPDINGDLAVDLADISLFELNLYGVYDYRSDFNFDGIINISDIVLFTEHGFALCGIPDPTHSTVTTAATEPVVILVAPLGDGDPISAAGTFGRTRTDATITVTVRDENDCPIPSCPAWRLVLESEFGNLAVCEDGAQADGPSDFDGRTTFSGALAAGGYSDVGGGERLRVVIDGQPITGQELDIYFRSPDIDGNLHVDCEDFSILAGDQNTTEFRSDLNNDGQVNLSDIIEIADFYGDNCLGLPHLGYTTVEANVPVLGLSLFSVPDGSGDPFSNCYIYDSGDRTDAELLVTLRDSYGEPVADHPADRVRLVPSNGNVLTCNATGLIGDGPSNASGVMTFTGPYQAGGHTDLQASMRVYLDDCDILESLAIRFNSPDINGDLVVDPADLTLLQQDLVSYDYRSDFNADGSVDTTDVIIFYEHFQVDCDGSTVGVRPPSLFVLHPNFPNPFNPRTTVRFDLPSATEVEVAIYDPAGRRIRTLVAREIMPAGRHEVVWNGRDGAGRPMASGAYFCRLVAGDLLATRSMTLLK